MKVEEKVFPRQAEIFKAYLKVLDQHLTDIVEGRTQEMLEIRGIAGLMNMHPTHLSNTIRSVTGNSACHYFEHKILALAKDLLEQNEMSISQIAGVLTYDPSNFTKFFKHYTQMTPKQYRNAHLIRQMAAKSVSLTKNSVTLTKVN